jgi:hypothetical protein
MELKIEENTFLVIYSKYYNMFTLADKFGDYFGDFNCA